jgi:hypothetical protein
MRRESVARRPQGTGRGGHRQQGERVVGGGALQAACTARRVLWRPLPRAKRHAIRCTYVVGEREGGVHPQQAGPGLAQQAPGGGANLTTYVCSTNSTFIGRSAVS